MTVRIADTVRNTMIDAIRAAIDAGAGPGLLRIYAGSKPGTKGATHGRRRDRTRQRHGRR